MNKQQWDELERNLSSPFGYAKLLIDGYEILLQTQVHKMRLCIAVYINGYIRSEHFLNDCEERRRFFCPNKHYVYKPKERAQWKKEPKRLLKKYNIDPDKSFFTYTPWWNTFRPLKAHLIKNNTSIELAPEAP